MATDSFIQVPPDSTGKKVDAVAVTTSAGAVLRQTFSIGDPTAPETRAGVSAIGLLTDGTGYTQAISAAALPPITFASPQAVTQSGAWAVTVSNLPATQPVSGAVTVSNLPATGQQNAANSLPVVLASDQLAGLDLSTASRQDVLIGLLSQLAQQILNCDTTNVTVAGGQLVITALPAVQAQVTATAPLPVTPSLPPNAAQETGGNLALLAQAIAALNQTISNLDANIGLLLAQHSMISGNQGGYAMPYN